MNHIFIITAAAVAIAAGGAFAQDAVVPPDSGTTTPVAPVTPAVPDAATTTEPATTPVTPVVPAPQPKFEAPAITADTAIFRRTPVIDGIIEEGEWDTYYSFSASGWDGATFVDWDGSNLYVAARSNKPCDLQAVVDANADGWFHGEDNYEFCTSGGTAGNMTLAVGRYESRNTKAPAAVPVTPEEARMIEVKSSRGEAGQMIEMRIPGALIKGMKLAADRKMGLQVSLNAGDSFSGWFPAKEIGDTNECTLVTRKFASLKPLELGFDLRSDRVARGEDLGARFHLTNSGTDTLNVRTFVIGGEGKAGEYLSSQRVRIEGITSRKHISHDVTSLVPSDMPLGCWAIGAEVRSATERLGSALISFEVVEPFSLELKMPSTPVKADVKDVSFIAVVHNNTRGRLSGVAKITLPSGWELWRNADTRQFTVMQPDAVSSVAFKAKPPLGAQGSIPVKIDVTAEGKTLTLEGKLTIVNP